MALTIEEIKLRVAIQTGESDLSGVQQLDESLGRAGQTVAATESSLNSLGKELAQVHSKFADLHVGTEAFDALKAKSQDLQAQIHQLSGASEKMIAPAAITNSRALNGAMIDLGRVIQDMPYGMQGIANNLQQLPGSMGRLREEADATGTSMSKLLLQGLMSPAGVGIAVSAITALWVAWDMYGAKVANALGLAGTKVADLDQQLEGIQKYKDFGLTVQIHGAEGLAKLKLELQQLIDQKAYLEGTLSRQAAIKEAKPSLVSTVISSLSGYYAADPTAYTNAKLELSTYESIAAEKIKGAKITLGETEDVRLMTTYYKMTTDEAKKQYAINQQNLNIEDKQSAIKLRIEKDAAKANKASPAESVAGWNAYAGAINEYNASMKKREEATDTVAEAEESAMKAREAYTAASKESATTDAGWAKVAEHLVNAKKDVSAADELLKTKTTAYNQSLKESETLHIQAEKYLGTYKDDTLSVSDALLGVKSAEERVAAAKRLGKEGSNELAEAVNIERYAHENMQKTLAKQKELYADIVSSVDAVGEAYVAMGGKAIKGLSDISKGLATVLTDSTKTTEGGGATWRWSDKSNRYAKPCSELSCSRCFKLCFDGESLYSRGNNGDLSHLIVVRWP